MIVVQIRKLDDDQGHHRSIKIELVSKMRRTAVSDEAHRRVITGEEASKTASLRPT